jgi:hypothetical protein
MFELSVEGCQMFSEERRAILEEAAAGTKVGRPESNPHL